MNYLAIAWYRINTLGQNLIDFIKLKQELEDLLGHEVDLAPSTGLREGMRESILKDAIPITNL